jgi:hypothetical protein
VTEEGKRTLHQRAKGGDSKKVVLLYHGGVLETFGEDAQTVTEDPSASYARLTLDMLPEVRRRIHRGWRSVYLLIREY